MVKGMNNIQSRWIPCPLCGGKMVKALPNTKAENFPGWCKHCKRQSIISIEPLSRVVSQK